MKYVIPVEVKSCSGSQEFIVEADSVEEAIEKFKNGYDEFLSEEIEVTDSEEIDVSAIYIHEGPIEKSIQDQLTQSQEREKVLQDENADLKHSLICANSDRNELYLAEKKKFQESQERVKDLESLPQGLLDLECALGEIEELKDLLYQSKMVLSALESLSKKQNHFITYSSHLQNCEWLKGEVNRECTCKRNSLISEYWHGVTKPSSQGEQV